MTSVNVNATNPLERAKFTRLADIGAPEREAIHFIKVELPSGDTFQLNRFLGHYSMLGLNFLLHIFNDGSCGLLHYELPREGFQVPTGPFNREIRQYWIRWLTAPTENQLVLLDKLASLVDGSGLRSHLMSHHDPRQASENEPFLISLNATLVLMGFAFVFTKYCCDKNLIALQGVAKQKGLGPICCDVNFNQMNGICSKSQADYRRNGVWSWHWLWVHAPERVPYQPSNSKWFKGVASSLEWESDKKQWRKTQTPCFTRTIWVHHCSVSVQLGQMVK